MTRCAIYARFSTDRQSETSAVDQVRDCRARAEREGWEVVEVYTDLAISGASNRRPGMVAMVASATAGAFDVVLSEALDRIARDQADIATIYKQLSFADVRIETLSEGAINELHIGLKGTMGALFLKDLADKIRRGQRGSLARGRIPGGRCYGYDVVRELDEQGRPDPGRRRINPDQAAVVRRIMQEYVGLRGPKAIAHGLNEDGIPSPHGGEWRASTIMGNRARQIGIFHNPIYVGRYVHNRVTMKVDPTSRKRVSRPNAVSDRQETEFPELRIVDDALWTAVQDARAARAAEPLVRRRRPKHLLSGLISCGSCNGAVVIFANDRMGCTRAREAGTCGNTRAIRLDELQRRVLAGLRDQLLSPEAVSLLVREYHLERERRRQEVGQTKRAAERRLAQAEAAVARLVNIIAEGGGEFADLRDALGRKIQERDRARAAVGEEAAVPVIALHPHVADAYRERVHRLTAGIDVGAMSDEVRASIRSLVEAIYVSPAGDGQTIEIIGSFESAIALASGNPAPTRGVPVSAMVVAEDRDHHSRRRRSFMA